MAIRDRWWKTETQPDGSKKRVRSADYGCEKRWQVRWRDGDGKQCAKNFTIRKGKNPEIHASAFDTQTKNQLDTDSYVSPKDANTTFKDYAEDWRTMRTHDVNTAENMEIRLRRHVYADPETPGKTPSGAPAIGHRLLRELAKRPSLIRAWINGIKLAPGSKLLVLGDVSSVFTAALDDGLVSKNPLRVQSVKSAWPDAPPKRLVIWSLQRVESMSAELDHPHPADKPHRATCGRYGVIPYLGVGSGMRQGEMFGFDAEEDIDFLRRFIHIRRQIRLVGDRFVFAPIKNDEIRENVLLADSLAVKLSEHIRKFPPVEVTLPWEFPDGEPRTHKLFLTRPDGRPLHRNTFDRYTWRPALRRAGIEDCRANGCHVTRHTGASAWLADGMDVATVALFLGDTIKTVVDTYLHADQSEDAQTRYRKVMDRFFTKRDDGQEGERGEAGA